MSRGLDRVATGVRSPHCNPFLGRVKRGAQGAFRRYPYFNNPVVQTQFQLFRELFEDGTRARAAYLDRLMYMSNVILDNAHSDDNKGEKRFYEMLT